MKNIWMWVGVLVAIAVISVIVFNNTPNNKKIAPMPGCPPCDGRMLKPEGGAELSPMCARLCPLLDK